MISLQKEQPQFQGIRKPQSVNQQKLIELCAKYNLDEDFIFEHCQPMGGGRLLRLLEHVTARVAQK